MEKPGNLINRVSFARLPDFLRLFIDYLSPKSIKNIKSTNEMGVAVETAEIMLRIAAGIGLLVLAAYLGIGRDKTQKCQQRVSFLCSLIFIWIAVVVANFVSVNVLSKSVTLTAENVRSVTLTFEILMNLLVGFPALAFTLRFISMRNRDAGYRPGIAYLGAIPLVQFFFVLWLLVAKPAVPSASRGAA